MRAEKLTLQTDGKGHLHGLPSLPPHTSVEVIFLFPETPTSLTTIRRKAPSKLAGQVKISGDIVSPAVSEDEWNAFQ